MAKATSNTVKTNNNVKIVDISTLKVDMKLNVRLANNYDVPAMKQAIMDIGRITDPIHVRLVDNVVLRGNRRTLGGQELLADPTCPQDLAAELRRVTVVYHDVAPGSPEELAIILDHGSQKGLSRTEVLNCVWRLDKQFMSEIQIMSQLYSALAGYTNNPQKALECSAIVNLGERKEFLRSWLHGTVGNYILAAAKMGNYIREQMYLTHLSEDKLLGKDEKVELRCSRTRITKLSAAKSKDLDTKNGGKGWSADNGGETFNALVEQFKSEDRGESEAETGPSRPSVKELKERADAFKSPAIRSALLVASGDKAQGRDLVDLDDQLHRLSLVTDTLTKRVGEITDPLVAALIKAIISTGPAGEVELAINKLVGK